MVEQPIPTWFNKCICLYGLLKRQPEYIKSLIWVVETPPQSSRHISAHGFHGSGICSQLAEYFQDLSKGQCVFKTLWVLKHSLSKWLTCLRIDWAWKAAGHHIDLSTQWLEHPANTSAGLAKGKQRNQHKLDMSWSAKLNIIISAIIYSSG